MCKVSSVCEVKSHECLSRLEASHQYSHVGLCSGVWLNVRIFSFEKFAESVDGKLLDLVNNFTSSIVPGSRVTLCIFVCAD